jgi:hypothetical protein
VNGRFVVIETPTTRYQQIVEKERIG